MGLATRSLDVCPSCFDLSVLGDAAGKINSVNEDRGFEDENFLGNSKRKKGSPFDSATVLSEALVLTALGAGLPRVGVRCLLLTAQWPR